MFFSNFYLCLLEMNLQWWRFLKSIVEVVGWKNKCKVIKA
jgi:hypothetical protein